MLSPYCYNFIKFHIMAPILSLAPAKNSTAVLFHALFTTAPFTCNSSLPFCPTPHSLPYSWASPLSPESLISLENWFIHYFSCLPPLSKCLLYLHKPKPLSHPWLLIMSSTLNQSTTLSPLDYTSLLIGSSDSTLAFLQTVLHTRKHPKMVLFETS